MSALSQDEALEAARMFLRGWLDLSPCDAPPAELYGFDPERELLFEVIASGPFLHVGASKFLAVDRNTGRVRMAGSVGE